MNSLCRPMVCPCPQLIRSQLHSRRWPEPVIAPLTMRRYKHKRVDDASDTRAASH